MEFFSFGGNSGSPVFFQPSSERNFAKNHNQRPPIYLTGLVMGSYQRKEVFLPNALLSQNIGIAAVVPSYKLYEILHSEEVKSNRNSGTEYAHIQKDNKNKKLINNFNPIRLKDGDLGQWTICHTKQGSLSQKLQGGYLPSNQQAKDSSSMTLFPIK
jgi:hypothetical protein